MSLDNKFTKQSSQDPRSQRSPTVSRLRSDANTSDNVSSSSVKRNRSSIRRQYRRRDSSGMSTSMQGQGSSSGQRRSSRPSAAAAEFWANFNYVDVVSGDDTSHKRARKRKQSIAVPRFSLDRRSSESRTIGSDSFAAGSGSDTKDDQDSKADDQVPSDPSHPYPEYAKYSFNCLDQKSYIRRICIRMITNPYPYSKQSTGHRYDDAQPQYAHNNDT